MRPPFLPRTFYMRHHPERHCYRPPMTARGTGSTPLLWAGSGWHTGSTGAGGGTLRVGTRIPRVHSLPLCKLVAIAIAFEYIVERQREPQQCGDTREACKLLPRHVERREYVYGAT